MTHQKSHSPRREGGARRRAQGSQITFQSSQSLPPPDPDAMILSGDAVQRGRHWSSYSFRQSSQIGVGREAFIWP